VNKLIDWFKQTLLSPKPSPRLVAWSQKLAIYAAKPWTPIFFFLIFFFDSFLVVIPSDPLLGLTASLVPGKRRAWLLASIGGVMAGLLLFMFLSLSSFQPIAINFLESYDLGNSFHNIHTHAHTFGYIELAAGVFTILPAIFGLVGGIVIGMDPAAVFFITALARVFRLVSIMLVFRGFWKVAVNTKLKLKRKKR